MRVGAVNYLNSKPLVEGLELLAPEIRLLFDLPSRLADSLAAGRLDVALIPSVEFFRSLGNSIVSDACVACRGPVLSVKIYFRRAPGAVRRLALDEGSRTSAALAQILLAEKYGIRPQTQGLPIGCGLDDADADAVLLIGDRAIASGSGQGGRYEGFVDEWDLGETWYRWTGLPFVFALWVARPNVDTARAAAFLGAARDQGVLRLREIAAVAAGRLGIDFELAARYLSDNLHFRLDHEEIRGLSRFYELCVTHGLVPSGCNEGWGRSWTLGLAADRKEIEW